MPSFLICYDGEYVSVEDTDEVYQRLQADPDFATDYMSRLLEERENLPGSVNMNFSFEEPSVSTQTAEEKPQEFKATCNNNNILLFLEVCLKRRDDLRNPKRKRKGIFNDIQAVLQEKAYTFTPLALDKKLSNLMQYYHSIVENNKKTSTGRGRISWMFFDIMSQIYHKETPIKECPLFDPPIINRKAIATVNSPTTTITMTSPTTSTFPTTTTTPRTTTQRSSTQRTTTPRADASSARFTLSDSSPTQGGFLISTSLTTTEITAEVPSSAISKTSKVDKARKEVLELEKKKLKVAESILESMQKLVGLEEQQLPTEERPLALEERKCSETDN